MGRFPCGYHDDNADVVALGVYLATTSPPVPIIAWIHVVSKQPLAAKDHCLGKLSFRPSALVQS